ncbi:methyl-accepting chemotaxis protein [Candidatus Endoriftia persephonae]|jgi:methyl-accepting chemotaxis protein|uniref:Methyl-accepting chemotaxis sensory transducer n=2 Tax=Gammaproteobacteria TaxID=1236 RepID=G2FBQ5_9GAMM|nr:methyl-accepting chemotaxis protein [Candidatus Endoriftia persephone]EGW55736.1 methyl-accepting chemotaxis sensory transducer [endosymbiont of Tevnia jerichonana (vent Tica)]USF86278.1 methyl-accepting chemotaxis protein [Candidatus Endoriftia persephone]
MRQVGIGAKIGGGFLVAGLILAASGLVGYWVISNLSSALAEITGPVWSSMESANGAIRGVQKQLIAVDQILAGRDSAQRTEMAEAERLTLEAIVRLKTSGRIAPQQLQALDGEIEVFVQAREELIRIHNAFQSAEAALSANAAAFQRLLVDVERLASQQMLERDLNSRSEEELGEFEEGDDRAPDEGEGDPRAVVSAAGEARLAVLSQLDLYRRFKQNSPPQDLDRQLGVIGEDLLYALEQISEDQLFSQPIRSGENVGKSHSQLLMEQLQEHRELLSASIERYAVRRQAHRDYTQVAEHLMQTVEQMTADNRAQVEVETGELQRLVSTGANSIIIAILLGLLVAVLAFMLTLRAIVRPIREVRDQLGSLSQGEGGLNVTLSVKGSDETAQLAQGFNAFTSKLRDMIAGVQESMNRLVSTTDDISRIADKAGEAVRYQQQEVASVTNAVAELTGSLQEVTANTFQAAERAGLADKETSQGRALVQQTLLLIQVVATEVEQATRVVNELGEKSESIGGVLDVIRGISEQTNLLALNAAIEAARAGEQGRGFAVVADEVRGLAARTNDSISEIQVMIDQLQQGTSQAIKVMTQARSQTQACVEPANQADTRLDQIAGMVRSITELNRGIANAAEAQHLTVVGVEKNLAGINEVAANTSSSAVELTTSTQVLSQLADELQALVGEFRV